MNKETEEVLIGLVVVIVLFHVLRPTAATVALASTNPVQSSAAQNIAFAADATTVANTFLGLFS